MMNTNYEKIRESIDQIAIAESDGFAVLAGRFTACFAFAYSSLGKDSQERVRRSLNALTVLHGPAHVFIAARYLGKLWLRVEGLHALSPTAVSTAMVAALKAVDFPPVILEEFAPWVIPIYPTPAASPPPQKRERTIEDVTRKLVRKFHRKRKNSERYRHFQILEAAQKLFRAVPRVKVMFQGGKKVKEPRLSKAERDKIRASQAKHDAEVRRKSVPKAERAADVKSQRDKRNPALQSGRVMTAVAAASVTATLVTSYALRSFFAKANEASDSITTLVAQLREYADSFKAKLGEFMWKVPIVMIAFYGMYRFRDSPIASLLLLTTAVSTILGPQMWSHISKFFPEGGVRPRTAPGIRVQGGFVDDFLSGAPKLLAIAMTMSVFGSPAKDMLGELGKRMSNFDRHTGGWESFLDWFLLSLESGVNWLISFFSDKRVSLVRQKHKEMRDWATEVNKFLQDDLLQAGEGLSAGHIDRLIQLIIKGSEFKEIYAKTHLGRYVDSIHQSAVLAMMPYQGSIAARNNFRVEPSMVMLYGQPGVGKTLIATQFAAAVMLESGLMPATSPPSDIKKEIWQKGTSEFWNGYVGQKVLVMDDAFQQRVDPTDKENECMSIIRMVSSWAFPLNFADLPSKGRIYFGSKFIYGTTNLRCILSEALNVIQEPGAVLRRMNFPLAIRVKEEYASEGMLNYRAYEAEVARCADDPLPFHRFPWHIWEVATHDFGTGVTGGDWKPLGEAVLQVAADMRQRLAAHTVAESNLDSFIKGYASPEVVAQAGRVHAVPAFGRFSPIPAMAEARGMTNEDLMRAIREDRERRENPYLVLPNYTDTYHHVREFYTRASLVKKVLAGIFVAGTVMVGVYVLKSALSLLWQFISSFFGGPKAETQSNRPVTSRRVKILKKPKESVEIPSAEVQACDDQIVDNTYNNTYKCYASNKSGVNIILGQVLFIEDVLAVMPAHFNAILRTHENNQVLDDESTIHLRHAGNTQLSFSMTYGAFKRLKKEISLDRDVCFVNFSNIRSHRNISAAFITEKDIKMLGNTSARLDVCNIDKKGQMLENPQRQTHTFSVIIYHNEINASGLRIQRVFRYIAPTDVGDCGAPLSMLNGRSYAGRSIIGLHVAGDRGNSYGFSNIVTQEMVAEASAKLRIVHDEMVPDLATRGIGFQSGNTMFMNECGSFVPIGKIDKAAHLCPKTSYYVTAELYGNLGPYECMPAPLSPVYRNGKLVYPMFNALKPYSSPVHLYEHDWLRQAVHVAMSPVMAAIRHSDKSDFTFEEAVLGITERKFRSIPRGTSAGFPYIFDVRNGKKEFFGDGEKYDLTGEMAVALKERVLYNNDMAAKGVRLAHIFVDNLKDELRSPAKVEAVATRLISAAPLDYLISWRMKFGAFGSAVMTKFIDSGMAPGLSATKDWPKLAEALRRKGKLVFDGDFKAFDSSQQVVIYDLIFEIIDNWYGGTSEQRMARKVLWLDLCHSRHLGGPGTDQTHIYQWHKSMPSGHPFTTIMNSIYSLVLLVSCYITLTGDVSGFWDEVSAITYGDDNVVNVSEKVAPLFNQSTVAQEMEELFDVKYTPGNKTDEFITTTTLDKVGFLKRSFVDSDKGWLCPLELDSFLYTHYWSKNRKLEKKILIDVLENALEELALHPEELWDKYAPTIIEVLEERAGSTRASPDQETYLKVVRSRTDNWY